MKCSLCEKEAKHYIAVAEKFGHLCDDHFNKIGETCPECEFYSGGHTPPQCDFWGMGISYELEDAGCKNYVPEWL